MEGYQQQFIQLALDCQVLKFGEFTLKSGRVSPYFFNAGQFQTGSALAKLGRFYAQALLDSNVPFDMIFGPAYKGIPLATAAAVALADKFDRDVPFAYNRKEAKSHGEGGVLVGAPLAGRVAIVDDVITAGTAVREVLAMITQAKAIASAIVIGLNRQERGQGDMSAIAELEQQTGIKVVSLIKLDDIMNYLETRSQVFPGVQDKIIAYRQQYGVNE
ncbi:MAG: orotate phosphoribosyltransferase [Marinagarivorans sp.]|nr:orotate phosphoribosyltransferase [Marinagarivorans sp.]